MGYNELTPEEQRILLHKGTERAGTGDFIGARSPKVSGTFICRQCNSPLYTTEAKFESGCGWPSFDDDLPDSVQRIPDADGMRTEIVCANCGGHLGHVFKGERFTEKNTRHCVNSLSIRFVPDGTDLPSVLSE